MNDISMADSTAMNVWHQPSMQIVAQLQGFANFLRLQILSTCTLESNNNTLQNSDSEGLSVTYTDSLTCIHLYIYLQILIIVRCRSLGAAGTKTKVMKATRGIVKVI